MLVLSRKASEELCIGDTIRVMVCEIRSGQVRLGVLAPAEIPVHRAEIYDQIHRHTPAELDLRQRMSAGEPLSKIEARHDRAEESDQMSKPLFTVQEFKYLQQVVANLREENTLLRAEIQNREHIQ